MKTRTNLTLINGPRGVTAIPHRSKSVGEHTPWRVMLLMIEQRVNRSGKAFTRRLSIHTSAEEFKAWASEVTQHLEALEAQS